MFLNKWAVENKTKKLLFLFHLILSNDQQKQGKKSERRQDCATHKKASVYILLLQENVGRRKHTAAMYDERQISIPMHFSKLACRFNISDRLSKHLNVLYKKYDIKALT